MCVYQKYLLLLALNSTEHGTELGDIGAPLTPTLEELGVGEMVTPRLSAPHWVRVAHGDVGPDIYVYTSIQDL